MKFVGFAGKEFVICSRNTKEYMQFVGNPGHESSPFVSGTKKKARRYSKLFKEFIRFCTYANNDETLAINLHWFFYKKSPYFQLDCIRWMLSLFAVDYY